jgi:uncharacterized protein YoxC
MKEVVFIQELKSWLEGLLANAPEVQQNLHDKQMQLQGEINAFNAVLNKMKELAQDVDQRYETTSLADSSDESRLCTQGEDSQGKSQDTDY